MVEMYSAERVVRTRKPNPQPNEDDARTAETRRFGRMVQSSESNGDTGTRHQCAVITLGMPRQINPSRISSPLPQPQTTTHVPPKTVLAFD